MGDSLLADRRKGSDSAKVVEAVGKFDNEHTNVIAGGDEEFEQIIFGGGKIGGKVAHVLVGFFEFGCAIYKESDIFAKSFFDFGESEGRVFDGIMENTGDDGVFVHAPVFEDLLDGDGVNDEGFASEASLAGMGFGGYNDGLVDTCHVVNYTLSLVESVYVTIMLCLWLA